MKKVVALILIVVVTSIALVLLLKNRNNIMSVTIVQLKRGDIVDYITTTGRVEAVEEALVRAKASARIERVLVEEGERVEKGAEIIRFDRIEAENAVKRAKINLEQAAIAFKKAKMKLEASERTYADPSELKSTLKDKEDNYQKALIAKDTAHRELEITQELYKVQAESLLSLQEKEDRLKQSQIELLQAKREWEEAKEYYSTRDKSTVNLGILQAEYENALKQKALAEVELELATYQKNQLLCTSPINGKVVAMEVKDGMIVSPGELLLTIADTSRLQVLAEVDELDAGFIKKGQEAIITFDAFPDQQFPAHVTKIAPQAIIKGDRTIVEAVVLLNDLTELLKISNQVDVKIIRDKKMNTLVLPISSVCEGSSPFVWLHRNSFISKTQVYTGLSDMDSIEIIDGLQENDEVVANCQGDLKDGTKVRVNKEFSTGKR